MCERRAYFGAIDAVDEHFANLPFAPRQRVDFGDAIELDELELMLLEPLIDDVDDGAHFMNLPLALRHWVFGIGDGAADATAGRTVDAASAAIVRMRRYTRGS